MQICPACKASNPDGVDTCERCSSHFDSETPFPGGRDNTPTIAAAYMPPATAGVTADFTAAGSATAARQAFSVGLFPGDVVADRYEILAHIGEGGMGSVYKALDRELERIVALKTIRPDLASNAAILRRFKQEILLARKVTHSNVIRIYDLGVAGALRFLTMEFFEGEDLCAYLERRGNLPPQEAVAIIRQVCEGLEAAHGEGVIHRDLKPQNILINAAGGVRILDFGLARGFEAPSVTRTGLAVGTPDYMAPEQARGEEASVRSDIYAVGLTFYELLTGELPFKGENAMARLAQRTLQPPPPPKSIKDEIPQHLDNIVMRCLELDPERRYEKAEELLADLKSWEEPQAPTAPHPSEAAVTSENAVKPRPYGKLIGLAAAVLVSCSALIGYFYTHSQKPAPSPTQITATSLSSNPEANDLVVKGRNLLKTRQDTRDTKIINDALDNFIQARTKDPAYSLAWAGIADANLDLYRLKHGSLYADQAKFAAERAYQLNNKEPGALLALGSVYAETGKRSEAVALLKQTVSLVPDSDEAHQRLGRAYLLMGKGAEAIEQYKKAVELNGYSWYNHDQLARAYLKFGQNDKAFEHFNKAAEYNSRNAEIHEGLGIIYSRQSRWPKCIEEFHKALKIKPTGSVYSNLGTALFVTGQYKEAAAMYQRAVEMNPEKYWLIGNMADAYRHSNQYEKAQEAYDHAIELASQRLQVNPQKAAVLGDLASYYAKKGGLAGLDEARRRIAEARSIDKHDNALMYIEGVIYAIGGDKNKAYESIREALQSGYSAEEVRRDPDLASIRSMPEFKELLKSYSVR